jgi:hypothetical protein
LGRGRVPKQDTEPDALFGLFSLLDPFLCFSNPLEIVLPDDEDLSSIFPTILQSISLDVSDYCHSTDSLRDIPVNLKFSRAKRTLSPQISADSSSRSNHQPRKLFYHTFGAFIEVCNSQNSSSVIGFIPCNQTDCRSLMGALFLLSNANIIYLRCHFEDPIQNGSSTKQVIIIDQTDIVSRSLRSGSSLTICA